MPVLRSLAAWLIMVVLAVLNGWFRQAVLLPNLGKPVAYLLSGLLLSTCVLVVAIALARWLGLRTRSRCLSVGALWFALTLVFEFGFGGLAEGRSWAEMLSDYTFKDGNIWPLVLAFMFFAPLVAARIRRPGPGADGHGA